MGEGRARERERRDAKFGNETRNICLRNYFRWHITPDSITRRAIHFPHFYSLNRRPLARPPARRGEKIAIRASLPRPPPLPPSTPRKIGPLIVIIPRPLSPGTRFLYYYFSHLSSRVFFFTFQTKLSAGIPTILPLSPARNKFRSVNFRRLFSPVYTWYSDVVSDSETQPLALWCWDFFCFVCFSKQTVVLK